MTYIGLDPGVSGSVCAITPNGPIAHKMPDTDRDLLDLLKSVVFSNDGKAVAVLEQVSAMPKQGVTSCFTFGEGYGKLQMALMAAEIPYEKCRPQKWMKALGCMSRGDKNVTKARAQELFPQLKITHAIADGLLIATYCQRKHTGTL
jgi:crossover junction endodeoxyribonuclease RuvC